MAEVDEAISISTTTGRAAKLGRWPGQPPPLASRPIGLD